MKRCITEETIRTSDYLNQIWGQFNSRIGIDYLRKNLIVIDKFGIGLPYKEFTNLPINFLIPKYFFHDNPSWNINYSKWVFQVGTRSTYLW